MKKFFKFILYIWYIFGFILFFALLLELFSIIALKFGACSKERIAYAGDSLIERENFLPDVYVDASWFFDIITSYREYVKNMRSRFGASYTHWDNTPYNSKYINNDTLAEDKLVVRRSWKNTKESSQKNQVNIYFFGGSTMWGYGTRDEHTIPSYVAKIVHQEYKIKAQVYNYGVLGFQSTQEGISLFKKLHFIIPSTTEKNIIIFMDGENDIWSAIFNQSSMNLMLGNAPLRWRYDFTNFALNIFSRSKFIYLINCKNMISHYEDEIYPISLGQDIIKVYKRNIQLIEALCQEVGLIPLFYWQPLLATKSKLSQYEKNELLIAKLYKKGVPLSQYISKAIDKEILNKNFHNITSIFNYYEKSMFIEPAHYTEEGNKIIAQKMAKDIINILENNP